jgi:hypothetical protein
MDRIKFTIDVIRAICFIRVTPVDDSSLIGRRISEPMIGINSRADSIVVFNIMDLSENKVVINTTLQNSLLSDIGN